LAASIEILYLRFPVHPNITVIQIGRASNGSTRKATATS